MNSEFVDDLEIKTEIKTEIEIEEWKPPDTSGLGNTSSDQSPDSHLNEIKNSNNFIDISNGPKIELEGL